MENKRETRSNRITIRVRPTIYNKLKDNNINISNYVNDFLELTLKENNKKTIGRLMKQ